MFSFSLGFGCSGKMRPIFCGNFDYETRQSDLERLFRRYGRVDRVDMKSGFAFIYMDSDRDADDAIRALDRTDFGRSKRRLRVEWTKQDRGTRMPGGSRGSAVNSRPSKTLFVINFDPYNTRARDLERHFEPYGKIVNVRIRRNFAFIQFESQEDATKALSAANTSKLMDRVISVEYAIRDDDDGNRYSRDRSRDRSPERTAHDRGRSLSPYRRERGSPDYGRGPSPNNYGRERGSPDYGRGPSPGPRRRQRTSPDYGRGYSRSPRRGERASDDYGRGPTLSPHHRERIDDDYGHGPSHSSHRREKAGADYGHGQSQISPQKENGGYGDSPSPSSQRRRGRAIDEYERGSARSPVRENSVPPYDHRNSRSTSPGKRIGHDRVPSPRREKDPDDYGRELSMSPSGKESAGNGYDRESSPFERERINLDQENGASPNSKHEPRDSSNSGGDDSPMHEGYG
ncbi:RNA recognition motif domain, partial [Dillenia turbinata]